VTALIFLLVGIAMILALRGQRALGMGLFAIAFVLSAMWLAHHMTDPLTLSF